MSYVYATEKLLKIVSYRVNGLQNWVSRKMGKANVFQRNTDRAIWTVIDNFQNFPMEFSQNIHLY